MDIVMVRAFNHMGPGQSEMFVVSDFCKQVAEISRGKRKISCWLETYQQSVILPMFVML